MKKKVLLSVIVFICVFMLVGCSSKDGKKEEIVVTNTPTPQEKEGNTKVGYLRFYAPIDYTYRPDLRGLMYAESEKKVYIKGDYENDSSNAIYLIAYVETMNKTAQEYVNEINNKLSDQDVKYIMKSSNKMNEIYVRENYVINGAVNYAYIIGKSGDIYVVNIKGPQDKDNEILELANDVFESLFIS